MQKKLGKITKINHPERHSRQPLFRSRIPLLLLVGTSLMMRAMRETERGGRESAKEKEGRRAAGGQRHGRGKFGNGEMEMATKVSREVGAFLKGA